VLLMGFNRPHLLRRVIGSLRAIEPPSLYLAVDGPRTSHVMDAELCSQSERLVEEIDWECDIHTKIETENLGCRRAVSSAISWFLSTNDFGVILEDDCVPHPDFFRFCAEMNDRFADNECVGTVSGNWFLGTRWRNDSDYVFSRYPLIWGWATWNRAWAHYDDEMDHWPQLRETDWLLGIANGHDDSARYWTDIFDRCYRGEVDSWAYRWTYSSWRSGLMSVTPTKNLVSNIGFGEDATHTRDTRNSRSAVPAEPLGAEIVGPMRGWPNSLVDRSTDDIVYSTSFRLPAWRRGFHRLVAPNVRASLRRRFETLK
jgi:hypothetical protein